MSATAQIEQSEDAPQSLAEVVEAVTSVPRERMQQRRAEKMVKYWRLQAKTSVCSVEWSSPGLDGRVRRVERSEEPESEAEKPKSKSSWEGFLSRPVSSFVSSWCVCTPCAFLE